MTSMIGHKSEGVGSFWRACQRKHGIATNDYHARSLADPAILDSDVEMLDLSDHPKLIRARVKNGTAHMAMDFERNKIPRRLPGDYWVILSPAAEPLVLVRVVGVEEVPFNKVSQAWAEVEGEGDNTLRWWREAHLAYFRNQCQLWNIPWSEEYSIVCESWELIESAA
jgi:uncharacterized protein YhfF